MKLTQLTSNMVEPLVIGGSILGGGGGGAIKEGLKLGRLAFEVGEPKIVTSDNLESDDTIITVSAVGAPAAKNQFVLPLDYADSVRLLNELAEKKPKAMITNENGGLATINGLFQSAITGIPILDAACNGRAHPTGVMGSMGLNLLPEYTSVQAAVGGKPNTEYRISQVLKGNLDATSKLVRQMSVLAGGFVAVARNPVTKSYLENNAALEAISHAYEVGVAHQSGSSAEEKINKVAEKLNGNIIAVGNVKDLKFETDGGFDLGKVNIDTQEGSFELTIWNEYITCEDSKGKRIATFPDLLMTFDTKTGDPVTSAELEEGRNITVLHSDKKNLKLGSGMHHKVNYEVVEEILQKEIIKYNNEIL